MEHKRKQHTTIENNREHQKRTSKTIQNNTKLYKTVNEKKEESSTKNKNIANNIQTKTHNKSIYKQKPHKNDQHVFARDTSNNQKLMKRIKNI